jgi:hypothetical protein
VERVGGASSYQFERRLEWQKLNKTIRHLGLRRLPIGHGPYNNQPKTGVRDDGYDGEDV